MALHYSLFNGMWRGLAVLVALLVLAGCGGDDNEAEPATTDNGSDYNIGPPITDSTYAIIVESEYGGDTLTTAHFQERYQQFAQQMPAVNMDPMQDQQLRRGLAEEFIRRHLLSGAADELGLEADTAAVQEQLAMIRSNFGSEEELNQVLSAQGLTMDSLRSAIADDIRLQQMQDRMLEEAEEPTAEDIEEFRQEQAEQVRAQHILFRAPGADEEEEVLSRARAVLDSIKAGADFATMAERYGSDATAQRGGDLGFFSRGEMVDPFSEAAFALQDSGDVASDLVETQFGYHIIRLTGRRTMEPMDSTRARSLLVQQNQREAFDEAFDRLRAKATIRVNPEVVGVDLNDGV